MFRVKVSADLFFNVKAKDKSVARNKVLKKLDSIRKIAVVDVSSMEIIEVSESDENKEADA